MNCNTLQQLLCWDQQFFLAAQNTLWLQSPWGINSSATMFTQLSSSKQGIFNWLWLIRLCHENTNKELQRQSHIKMATVLRKAHMGSALTLRRAGLVEHTSPTFVPPLPQSPSLSPSLLGENQLLLFTTSCFSGDQAHYDLQTWLLLSQKIVSYARIYPITFWVWTSRPTGLSGPGQFVLSLCHPGCITVWASNTRVHLCTCLWLFMNMRFMNAFTYISKSVSSLF